MAECQCWSVVSELEDLHRQLPKTLDRYPSYLEADAWGLLPHGLEVLQDRLLLFSDQTPQAHHRSHVKNTLCTCRVKLAWRWGLAFITMPFVTWPAFPECCVPPGLGVPFHTCHTVTHLLVTARIASDYMDKLFTAS